MDKSSQAKWSSLTEIAEKGLGPILNFFFFRLHSHLTAANNGESRCFFVLRAGHRMEKLYSTWLRSRSISPPLNITPFICSRVLAIKAVFPSNPHLAVAALEKELNSKSARHSVISLLGRGLAAEEKEAVGDHTFEDFIFSHSSIAASVRRELFSQSTYLKHYLGSLTGSAKRIILVDTGWKGTSQLLLEHAFPELEWEGLYFGCIGRAHLLGNTPRRLTGLVFDSEFFKPSDPATAFIFHRHLIESLFEPDFPSFDKVGPEQVGVPYPLIPENLRSKNPWDEIFHRVDRFLSQNGTNRLTELITDYEAAMDKLAHSLAYPHPEEVPLLQGKSRSHDLGRAGEIEPVYPPQNRFPNDNPQLRVREAIWPNGQAAIEFSLQLAQQIQNQLVLGRSESVSASYFSSPTVLAGIPHPFAGKVAIITRTKDRPILFRRAARSIAAQTYDNYIWVVVNDGGDPEPVKALIERSGVDPGKMLLCSNPHSLGMEAASNIGIRNSQSEFIVIHDDDDSWHPDFLKKTVQFLKDSPQLYKGVVSKTWYVSEEIVGEEVIEYKKTPYNDWLNSVHLAEMAIENTFAPISFLYQRDLWENVGGYDENLPVLGDWDFNLKFLLQADIGILPERLASYHHRDRESSISNYANSVKGGVTLHTSYNALIRNRFVRESLKDPNRNLIGSLMIEAYNQKDSRARLNRLAQRK